MRIKNSPIFFALFIIFLSSGCNTQDDPAAPFHMDKKYWTADDYGVINNILSARNSSDQELPNISNPKLLPVFDKIVDTNNVAVIAGDNTLGITNRADFANNFFDQYKDLVRNYSPIDRQDKYKYPEEFVDVLRFGLYLQLYYVTLENQKIIKGADDPNAGDVTSLITSNLQVLIDNYNLYLDHINYEERFNDNALSSYADGIKIFFPRVINEIAPDGDYSKMLTRIDDMMKKVKNQSIMQQLQNIKDLINNKTKK